ncbi:hypothetical protein [Cryobacterium ruanii]|uniref:SsuA/THI5-like domain-containing protein n=1 Tax=Cryobacterium ruanii TaxID=1259197 RepID=A0A4R9AL05_9MICO|nr:hypothetical protein [Cryobacterium ruanii]TFD64377.1 hypothetical protein E3T47_13010 [Cryobacterium ruanii]
MPATSEQTAPLTRGARGVAELRLPSSPMGVHRRLPSSPMGVHRRLPSSPMGVHRRLPSSPMGVHRRLRGGLSEDEGLDLTMVEGGPNIVPPDVLAAGHVDYAISCVPEVHGSIEQGANISIEWERFVGMEQADVAQDDISLIQQAFDMNAFLSGDIDAAQVMTYNEYAQVLAIVNEDTVELYQPDELNVIDTIFIVSPPPPTQKASDIRD